MPFINTGLWNLLVDENYQFENMVIPFVAVFIELNTPIRMVL